MCRWRNLQLCSSTSRWSIYLPNLSVRNYSIHFFHLIHIAAMIDIWTIVRALFQIPLSMVPFYLRPTLVILFLWQDCWSIWAGNQQPCHRTITTTRKFPTHRTLEASSTYRAANFRTWGAERACGPRSIFVSQLFYDTIVHATLTKLCQESQRRWDLFTRN